MLPLLSLSFIIKAAVDFFSFIYLVCMCTRLLARGALLTNLPNHFINLLMKLISYCLLIATTLLLLQPALLQGQDFAKSYIGPSPTAASLGTYGQVPVSEYAGIPDIKIPLTSVDADGFSLPITLSYHGSTLKTSDDASWVGSGWSLNAGGVITRVKRDQNDLGPNGFYYTNANRACDGNIDQEPDMYYYNIGGMSGKFLLLGPSTTPTIRHFTRNNIKISYNQYQNTWTLITGDGVTYFFSEPEFINETSTGNNNSTESYVSAWYVTSITPPTGTKINFSYRSAYSRIRTVYKYGSEETTNPVGTEIPAYAYGSCCQQVHGAIVGAYSQTVITVDVDDVILDRIDYPNGALKFITSDRTDLTVKEGTSPAQKLDAVQVYSVQNGNESLIKSFNLQFDHFTLRSYATPPLPSSRLRLRQVTESTPAATAKPHLFYYSHDTLQEKKSGFVNFLGTEGMLRSITYPTGGSSHFVWENVSVQPSGYDRNGARVKKMYDLNGTDTLNVRRYEYTGAKVMGKIHGSFSYQYKLTPTITCCDQPTVTLTINRNVKVFADFSSLGETGNGNLFGHNKVITWFGENGENGKKESTFENTEPYDPNYYTGFYSIPVPLDIPNKNGLLKEEWEYRNENGSFKPLRRSIYNYTATDAVITPARRHAYGSCNWTYNTTTEWVQLTNQTQYTYNTAGNSSIYVTTNYFYDDPDNVQATRITTLDSKGKTIETYNYYAKQKAASAGGIYTAMLNKYMINPLLEQHVSRNNTIVLRTLTSYKDWFNNGKVIKPETVQQSKTTDAGDVTVRYLAYDENGNVLALSKEKGKPVAYLWGYGNSYPVAEVTNADPAPYYTYATRNHNVGRFIDIGIGKSSVFEPFTTNHAQTYEFSVRLITIVPTGTFNGAIRVQLLDATGYQVFTKEYRQEGTFKESVSLPNGSGTYHFVATTVHPGTGTTQIRFDVTSQYVVKNTANNYFHTSFEELTTGFVTDSKTGKQCIRAPYNVPANRKPGNYLVSWWQKPIGGGNWTYQEQTITIAAGSPDFTIGTPDLLVDEIRLHPQDAMMTTYTYEPMIGMTSKCDARGQVTYYEYDGLHRLRVVRDHNRNIIKMIEYNYRNN
jgi:YD repeat-containing protein